LKIPGNGEHIAAAVVGEQCVVALVCDVLLNSAHCRTKYLHTMMVDVIFCFEYYTGRFIMLSVITNIYNKKIKGPALMDLFTATGKLKRFFDH
jgi:hypothetical protein